MGQIRWSGRGLAAPEVRPLAGLAERQDVGLAVLEPPTVLSVDAPGTRELELRTAPMAAVRPHPRRNYPPAVPASPHAVTTVMPVVSA